MCWIVLYVIIRKDAGNHLLLDSIEIENISVTAHVNFPHILQNIQNSEFVWKIDTSEHAVLFLNPKLLIESSARLVLHQNLLNKTISSAILNFEILCLQFGFWTPNY
jgi:hypothetical protein